MALQRGMFLVETYVVQFVPGVEKLKCGFCKALNAICWQGGEDVLRNKRKAKKSRKKDIILGITLIELVEADNRTISRQQREWLARHLSLFPHAVFLLTYINLG